jgi:hemolysin activation/secretion protein
MTANPWFSGSRTNLHDITSSTKSSGHWVTLTPSFSWQFPIYTNWLTTLRADGQWASEPLISNEQFGAGGVNSVRGYREGEVFGDTGWHLSLEQQTPPHTVGIAYGNTPLVVRGSVYMDYAQTYLLDPQGRPGEVSLWGTGFGFVTSMGPHWETRFLFSVPLLKTTTTTSYQPFFNFALTAQF